MRIVSAKSLCLLFGLLVPCLGMETRAEAGVIPWLYDSIFGYGWGGGYGGGMQYGAGYGGGYGMGYAAPMYSAPVYAAPVMSAPVAPIDGTYNAHYGPALGYYGDGYGSSYVVDSGSCCTPCSACPTGDCATSIQSSKPAPQPTPADQSMPVNPKSKRGLPPDDMVPATGTGVRGREIPGDDAMPKEEIRPARPLGGVGDPTDLVVPVEGGPEVAPDPIPGTKLNFVPTDRNIAVRYVPTPQRSVVAIPRSTARVVRIDRATREQLSRAEPKPQLASNP